MDQVKNFIDMVAQGNNAEAKSTLEDILSAKAFEALDDKKRELASNIFKTEDSVEQEQAGS